MANPRRGKSEMAQKESAKKLFNGSRAFQIPYFQRSYVWDEEHWDRFLDDMEKISAEGKGYFMGFIVLKTIDAGSAPPLAEVIDGQQRLTTFYIFSKVLCEIDEKHKGKIAFFDEDDEIILDHNYNDRDIFKAIISGEKIDQKKQQAYEENKVLRCYDYFKEHLEANSDRIDNIDFDEILEHLFFIRMSLSEKDDAQQIFDTMNSLGVSLTTSELLKNELFETDEEAFYEDTWRKTFEEDFAKDFWENTTLAGRAKRTHMDILLQSFLLIKYPELGEKKYQKADRLFYNFKEIFDTHKILDNPDEKKKFIYELIEYAELYREYIDPDDVAIDLANKKEDNKITQRLNIILFTMNITTLIPFILFILKTIEEDDEREKIFELLEIFVMRRIIDPDGSVANYNNYFARHIKGKRNTYEELRKIMYSSEDQTSNMPTNEALKNSFASRKFRNTTAKLILYFLEHHKRGRENGTTLIAIKRFSLEHVMPKKWRENWKEPKDITPEERDETIHRPGNLTLLTPNINAAISNSGWQRKLNGKPAEKGQKGLQGLDILCAGITTFSKYLTIDDWNEGVIEQRNNELLEIAKDLWKFDPPPKDDKEDE